MKNFIRRISALILVILMAVTITPPVPAQATDGRTARIYDYTNQVTVTRGKTNLKAYKGMRLKEGDTIKTGKDSNAYIQIDSDKVVKLDASTIITISNMSGTDKSGSINITLSSGKIYNTIKKKLTKNSTYKVKTPNAVMGVRGTTFVVDLKLLADESNETELKVLEGTVAFAPSEQEESNVYVGMNQMTNTTDLTEVGKPAVTEMTSNDLGTFELTEIMKDANLKRNIKVLLDKENKTLEEAMKQAEKEEKDKDKDKQENQNGNQGENSNSNSGTNDSGNANDNAGEHPNTNGNNNSSVNSNTSNSSNNGSSSSNSGRTNTKN